MWKLHFVREIEESWVLLCLGQRPALVRTLCWQFFCERSFKIVGTCKGTPTIYFHPLVQGYRGRGIHGKYHASHATTEWHEGPTMHIPLLAARHSYPASWRKGWRQTNNAVISWQYTYLAVFSLHFITTIKTCFFSRFYLLWWCFTSSN